MNPFDAIAGLLPSSRKSHGDVSTAPIIMRADSGYGLESLAWDDKRALADSYGGHVWAYAAMDIRATAAMTVPLVAQIYSQRSETWESTLPDQVPDLQKWLANPNPRMSMAEFVYRSCSMLDGTGNQLSRKITRGDRPDGEILATWPLLPGTYKPIKDGRGYASKYKYQGQPAPGTEREIPAEQVVHWQYPNPNDFAWGLPKLKPASKTIDADRAADLWNLSSMKRRAVKDMLLTLGGSGVPSPEQFAEIKEMARKELEGPDVAHGVGVIPGDWKAHELNRSPVEMDFLEQQKLVIQKISATFGLLPALLSPEAATYSNLQGAIEWVYDQTMPAFMRWFLGPINREIVPSYVPKGSNLRVRVIADWGRVEARRKAMFQRVETLDKMVRAGTPYNEAVEFLGLDLEAQDDGDEPHGLSLPLRLATERGAGLSAPPGSAGAGGGGRGSKAARPRNTKARQQAEPLFRAVSTAAVAVQREFVSLARELAGSVSVSDLQAAIAAGDPEAVASAVKLDRLRELMVRLEPAVVAGALQGAGIGAEQVQRLVEVDLSIDNAEIESRARRLSRERSRLMVEGENGDGGARRGFEDFVAKAHAADPTGGLLLSLTAQLPLLATIGRQSQEAAWRMVEGLHASGASPESIAVKLDRLVEKGVAAEAAEIGGDQGHGGVLGGQRDGWDQFRQQGVVMVSVWIDSDDGRVCPECISLNGEEKVGDESGAGFYVAPLTGGQYLGPGPDLGPHYKCRCGEIIGSAEVREAA